MANPKTITKPRTKVKTSKNKYQEDADLIDFVISKEGFLNNPQDIGDGKITLGSGLTDPRWHALYKKRGNVWSKEDNRMAVSDELSKRRTWAEKNFPNWNDIHPDSQKALLSYKYNYDFTEKNSPKMFQAAREKRWKDVAAQMDATSKNPKFAKGLLSRRKEEQKWFLKNMDLSQNNLEQTPNKNTSVNNDKSVAKLNENALQWAISENPQNTQILRQIDAETPILSTQEPTINKNSNESIFGKYGTLVSNLSNRIKENAAKAPKRNILDIFKSTFQDRIPPGYRQGQYGGGTFGGHGASGSG